ncbi:MAG TPA: HAD-IA family hydrolase [Syntrophorhabdaceae bacterium]|jgi:HAD superfamily hydrolase (TIGR01509 family)
MDKGVPASGLRGEITKNVKAVIFDIDGTLIDSFEAYYKAFNSGLKAYNLGPVSREFLGDCLGKVPGLREILRPVFPKEVEETTLDGCMGEIKRVFLQVEAEEVRPFSGVERLFLHLRERGVKIGIATGRMSSEEDEWKRFTRFGLDGCIGAIVTSREVKNRKPAPDVIAECARRLGVAGGECIAVGDREADVVAARAAGAWAVAVVTGQEDRECLEMSGADRVFDSVNDLVAFLETALNP